MTKSIHETIFFEFLKGSYSKSLTSPVHMLNKDVVWKIWVEYALSTFTDSEIIEFGWLDLLRVKIDRLSINPAEYIADKTTDYTIMDVACMHGKINILKWLNEAYKCNFTTINVIIAAIHGQFDTVKYIYEKDNNLVTYSVFLSSCMHGHLDLSKWLINVLDISINVSSAILCIVDGCNKNIEMTWFYGELKNDAYREFFIKSLFNQYYERNFDLLQWLHSNQDFNKYIYMDSIKLKSVIMAHNGNLESLKWLASKYSNLIEHSHMSWASETGMLNVMEWLNENYRDEVNTSDAITHAAKNSEYKAVEFLLKNNYSFGFTALKEAYNRDKNIYNLLTEKIIKDKIKIPITKLIIIHILGRYGNTSEIYKFIMQNSIVTN